MCPEVCSLSDYKPTHAYSEDEPPQCPDASVWNDKKHMCLGPEGTAQSFVSGELDSPFMFCYRMAQLVWKVSLSSGYVDSLHSDSAPSTHKVQETSNSSQKVFSVSQYKTSSCQQYV